MSSGKRKPQQSVNKYGGNTTKKVKSDGPDIPSSNFAAAKSKPQTTRFPARIAPESINSLPQNAPNLKNPTAILNQMNLPDVYRDVMGPDMKQLQKYAEAKKKKEAEMKKRMEKEKPELERLKKEQEEEKQREKAAQPKQVRQDESGRLVDEKGNVINLNPVKASSLKVNINKSKQERVKELLKVQRGTGVNRSSKLFDPALQSKSAMMREKRKNNAFHFLEKGTITQKADFLRSQAEEIAGNSEQAQEMVSEDGTMNKLRALDNQKVTPSDVQIGIRRVTVRVRRHDPIPDVEWWDAPLLISDRKSYLPDDLLASEKEGIQKEKYEGDRKGEEENGQEQGSTRTDEQNKETLIERLKTSLKYLESESFTGDIFQKEKITNMVEHPASFKTEGSNQNVVIPTYLTADEKKKLRRKRRLEKEKDKQEKIRLGLIKPPPPKLKFSNFMNIMKDEAVLDPTKVDMEVRKATAERLQNHLDRNAKKKLTKEQKAEKNMRKLRRDSALECRVAVFRIENLSHGAHKFKVNMNAQQLALNGVCIIADKKLGLNLPNVVVVEGGPKAIKFYKKLMLRRIKWTLRNQKDAVPGAEGEGEKTTTRPELDNKCTLVWEGVLKDHNFNKWRVVEIKSELEGRRLLSDRGVEFYWDRALTGEAAEDQDND